MAFKGDLRNVQLADLFQTLAQNRQEGVLTVTTQSGTHRVLLSKDGVSLLEPSILGRRRLGEILVFAGVLTEVDLAAALREQARTKKFLGEVLVSSKRVPQETLDRILAIQVDEEIYELFRFQGGSFEFAEGDIPSILRRSAHKVRPLAVEHVVLEAARRLDEWSQIEQLIPSIDGLYLANCAPESLADDEEGRTVLERLDGRHTVRDVADALLDSPFAVAKILARLVEHDRARQATREELVLTARELLTEGQKARALRLLHRVAQLSPEPCPLDPQLADMFKLAGDLKAAAQMRLKIATSARAENKLDSARHELEAALKEWPGAPTLLQPLIGVLREQGDHPNELLRARELAEILTESGATDGALAVMERVLELAPDDAEARRRYSDLCLRAHLREKAIEVLERDAARLKREGRGAELAAVYKRILAIDGGRKDIRRALAVVTRTKADRMLRAAGVAAAVVALLALAGFVGWRAHGKSQALAAIDAAAAQLAAGDIDGARRAIEAILAEDPVAAVAQPALELLDRIDEQAAQSTRTRRSARDERLSGQLTAIQELSDARQHDAALDAAIKLLLEQKEAYLSDRVRTRVQAISQEFLAMVARAKEAAAAYRPPARDAEVAAAWQHMESVFPLALATAAPRVREVAFESARLVEGEMRTWMHELVASAESFVALEQRMRPALEELRKRHERIGLLQKLSVDYIDAVRAAEAGHVEQARELLRKVLAEYGEGELAALFQDRIRRLDAAAAAIERIDALVAEGAIDEANAQARRTAEEFRDLQVPATLRIPIRIDSLPHGARVRLDGRELGTTPLVLRLPAGTTALVELSSGARAPQRTAIAADGPARCDIELPRRTVAAGRVEVQALTAPVFAAGRFGIAGRDGALLDVAAAAGGTLAARRHATGSLSGALAAPLALDDGFVVALFEGDVVRMRSSDGGLVAAWKRSLGDEFHHAPLAFGELLAVVGSGGRVHRLARADGAPLPEIALGGRVAGAPLADGGRLWVPLVGGRLVAVDVAAATLAVDRSVGHDLVDGLAKEGGEFVAATATGELLLLDATDGKVKGVIELGEVPVAPPRLSAGFADVPLGKRLVRIDLKRRAVAREWRDLAPTATPVLIDELLWLPCEGGVVQVLDPQREQPVERARLGRGPLAGAPIATPLGIALLARDGSFLLLER